MKRGLKNNLDLWAGLMLAGTGTAAIIISRDYKFGTVTAMGPGFFPTILGGILVVFGIWVIFIGVLSKEKIKTPLSLRALIFITLAMVLFGILMKHAGFVPAMMAVSFISAAAGKEFKFLEVLLLSTGLTLASTALFIWALGLPYPLLKGFDF
jgi:hypothetical protein